MGWGKGASLAGSRTACCGADDVRRPRTPLQHLIDEDTDPAGFDRRAHFQQWVEHAVGCAHGTEIFDHETNRLMNINYSVHGHVWTDGDIRELLE